MSDFELIEYEPEHALEIITKGAVEPCLEVNEITAKWAKDAKAAGPAITGVIGDEVLGCAGMSKMWPGVAEMWILYRFDVGEHPIDHRKMKKWFDEQIANLGLVRLQTPLKVPLHDVAKRYVEWMGFKPEAFLRKYHQDGSDALMYALIKE